jgi:hypothetical protein
LMHLVDISRIAHFLLVGYAAITYSGQLVMLL